MEWSNARRGDEPWRRSWYATAACVRCSGAEATRGWPIAIAALREDRALRGGPRGGAAHIVCYEGGVVSCGTAGTHLGDAVMMDGGRGSFADRGYFNFDECIALNLSDRGCAADAWHGCRRRGGPRAGRDAVFRTLTAIAACGAALAGAMSWCAVRLGGTPSRRRDRRARRASRAGSKSRRRGSGREANGFGGRYKVIAVAARTVRGRRCCDARRPRARWRRGPVRILAIARPCNQADDARAVVTESRRSCGDTAATRQGRVTSGRGMKTALALVVLLLSMDAHGMRGHFEAAGVTDVMRAGPGHAHADMAAARGGGAVHVGHPGQRQSHDLGEPLPCVGLTSEETLLGMAADDRGRFAGGGLSVGPHDGEGTMDAGPEWCTRRRGSTAHGGDAEDVGVSAPELFPSQERLLDAALGGHDDAGSDLVGLAGVGPFSCGADLSRNLAMRGCPWSSARHRSGADAAEDVFGDDGCGGPRAGGGRRLRDLLVDDAGNSGRGGGAGVVQTYRGAEPPWRAGLAPSESATLGEPKCTGNRCSRGPSVHAPAVGQMHPRLEPPPWAGLRRWEPPTVGWLARGAAGGWTKALAADADGCRRRMLNTTMTGNLMDLAARSLRALRRRLRAVCASGYVETGTGDGGEDETRRRGGCWRRCVENLIDGADGAGGGGGSGVAQKHGRAEPSWRTGLALSESATLGEPTRTGGRRGRGPLARATAVGQLRPLLELPTRAGLRSWETPTVGRRAPGDAVGWTMAEIVDRCGRGMHALACGGGHLRRWRSPPAATGADVGGGDGCETDEGHHYLEGYSSKLLSSLEADAAQWSARAAPSYTDGNAQPSPDSIVDGGLFMGDGGREVTFALVEHVLGPTARGSWASLSRRSTDFGHGDDMYCNGRGQGRRARFVDAGARLPDGVPRLHGPRPYWCGAARVGEARHPGPPARIGTWQPRQRLRRVATGEAPAVAYPRPGKEGFYDYTSPGFAGGDRSAGEGEFQLRIETANTTGWSALKRRLLSTHAQVLLSQETWIPHARMAEASAWARKRGWKSVWAPSAIGDGGGPSGGVAIFARDHVGMSFPETGSHIWHEARAVAAVVEAPGFRPMLVASLYLVSGAGTDRRNLEVMADVGRCLKAQGEGWLAVVAGDFNLTPQDVVDVGFDRQLGASIFHPQTSRGTFRTSVTASLLDFFLVSDQLAAAVSKVETVEASGMKAHVPVQLAFRPRATALRALHVRKPPELAFDRIYGPLQPPPCWDRARDAAQEALRAARAGSACAGDKLEAAYKEWADTAERELEAFAGCSVKKRGLRGGATCLGVEVGSARTPA